MIVLKLTRLLQIAKHSEEASEQPSVVGHILHTHCLSYTVHRERRNPHVHRPHPHATSEDGSDGAATGRVIPNDKLLNLGLGQTRYLSQQEPGLQVGSVPLVLV